MGIIHRVVRVISEIFEDIDQMQLFEKIIKDEKTYAKISRLLGDNENIKMAT